jgi:hypothetical protein
VIGKAFFRRETGHANVNTRFLGIALRIFRTHFADFSNGGLEQHDINMVMLARLRFGAELPERAAFH